MIRLRIIVALFAAQVLVLAGCGKVELYSNLREREANQMMAILLDSGIQCSKKAGDEEQTWILYVSNEQFSKAVNMLTSTGYPYDRHEKMGDVFKKSGLVSSPTEDRIRFVYALSEEIAETLSRIDGVVDARVHVVLPNNDPFSEKIRPSSASVYIKHRLDADVSASRAEIKDLVAKSIEGLSSDNIEVFLDEVEPIARPTIDVSYSNLLGLRVESGSVRSFWLLFGTLIAVAVISVGFVGWFVYRDYWMKPSGDNTRGASASHDSHVAPA